MSILVVDVGTSSVRVLVVHDDGTTSHERHVETLPTSPHPGLVEFDPAAMATAARDLCDGVTDEVGDVAALAIANQRASTVLWDARTGEALGPGLGWQDVRTVGRCLELRAQGLRVAPNQSATKAEWLIGQTDVAAEHLRLGTVDAWIAWRLSAGAHHVTDATNAAVTGLYDVATAAWDDDVLDRLGIPRTALPEVVDTLGVAGQADDVHHAPPIAAICGDQQASLVGQGCIDGGDAKVTFGTGGMLDICLDAPPPVQPPSGTFPIVTRQQDGRPSFGIEAVMLAAGTSVEWLRDGLGIIESAEESAALAGTVDSTDGVVFVPSLSGTGTPEWDHGARGLLIGVSRGTTRAHVVRAVLEGIAQRGADLVEAAEEAAGLRIDALRIDGGMSRNPIFVQALADAAQRPVEVSAEREATALGAGFLAGVAVGTWSGLGDAVASRRSPTTVEPDGTLDRERFADARARAARWIPEISDLDL